MATIPLPALDIKPPAQPDLMGQYAKLAQIRSMMGEQQLQQGQQQLQQQQVQQNQQNLGATDALNKAFQGAVTVDPNTGNPTFDRNAVINSVSQAGYGAKVPELTESFNKLDQSAATLQKTQGEVQTQTQDYFGGLAASIKKTAKNPDGSWNMSIVNPLIAHAATLGPQYAAKALQLQQQVQQDPTHLDNILDQVITASSKQRELGAAETTAASRQTTADTAAHKQQVQEASTQLSMAPDQATYTAMRGKLSPAIATLFPDQFDKQAVLKVGMSPDQAVTTDQKERELYNQSHPTAKDQYVQRMENLRAELGRSSANGNATQRQGIASLQTQSQKYSDFLSSANTLKQSLAAAGNGNEMAAAIAPLQGTLFITTTEGVKRINETELQGVSGAGSLVQRINGSLGKMTGSGRCHRS